MSLHSGERVVVDIVINNHNYGRFVTDAIGSACAQDHPDVNVIVVDDGSTDDSRERIRAYEGAVDIVLKDNGGQASALNAGFGRSRGDAVIFLDADDLLRAHAASLVAAAFARDPQAARVQFRMDVIDSSGRPTAAAKPRPDLPMPSGDLRRAELAFPFELPWLPTSGNAFRSVALERILPIPEDKYGVAGADWYLVHLTTLLGSVISVDEVAASYRIHGANRYEPQSPRVDLRSVRQTIAYGQATSPALAQLADELGLERPRPILSLSNLGNRLISLKLAPELHPLPGDRSARLVFDAARAAARRFDVSLPMKVMFVIWFAALAASPRPAAGRLAELFLFPERRPRLTRLSGRLHRVPSS